MIQAGMDKYIFIKRDCATYIVVWYIYSNEYVIFENTNRQNR